MQRKLYMFWGHSVIYPNNYIVLVGPSGQTRKGEPIQTAKSFAESLQIPLLPEDTSMESLIRKIRNSSTNYTNQDTGELMVQASIAGFLEELSVLIGERNTRFLAYLTNWYDSRDTWTRETKHQGDDDISGMCFNLVAATAPDWIPYMFTKEAIGGGFTSRCLFVVEQRKSKIISNPNKYPLNQQLREDLIHDLEHIHALSGEISFDAAGLSAYERWYEAQERDIERGKFPIPDPLFHGYVSRRATHVKKIAMALSVSRNASRIITEGDFKKALALMENLEKKMPRAFMGVGKPKFIEETDLVITFLQSRRRASKSEILRTFHRTLDDFALEAAIRVMDGMRIIRITKDPQTRETYYEYVS